MDGINKKRKIRTKAASIFLGIASGLVWGLGQLFNKQWIKALFFFIFFAGLIGIEVGTSKYGKKISAYDKVPGHTMVYKGNDSALQNHLYVNMDAYFYENYAEKSLEFPEKYTEFLQLRLEEKMGEFEFIEFLAEEIKENSPIQFTNLKSKNVISSNVKEHQDEYNDIIKNYEMILPTGTLYTNDGVTFYKKILVSDSYIYRQVDFLTEKEIKDATEYPALSNAVEYRKILTIDREKNDTKPASFYSNGVDIYLDVEIGGIPYYINVETKKTIRELSPDITPLNNLGPIYLNSETYDFYEKYEPELVYNGNILRYKKTPFTEAVAYAFSEMKKNPLIASTFTNDVFQHFHFRLYLAVNKELKNTFEKDFENFFYGKAGFFLKGFWGLATLGTTKTLTINVSSLNDILFSDYKTTYDPIEDYNFQGHISTKILLDSLISTIALLFFLIFMIWSIIDAYKTSERIRKEQEILKTKEYFKHVYEESFEYIVLSPALFVLAFISIMPIFFGFLIAFTSISGDASLSGTFGWIGFKNFGALFNFSSNLGASFGRAFWKVLIWTFIWAIFSTLTVFFAGFFQALILNSKRVVFRKFWRSLFILPWAVPAIISQMVFKVMFNETGFVNQFLGSIGVNDLFRSLGWLGRDFSLLKGAEKWFYLGKDNIQWFTNPYNKSFVRTSLILLNIWLGFPYFMALMTGVMTSIDKTLYEAADIDGATSGQKLRKITMPLVLYSTTPILVMTFSSNFNNFGVIYFITGGGPNAGNLANGFAGDTDILISWMYKLTVDEKIYNIASVFSILIFIFVGTITAISLSKTRAFKGEM